MGHMASLSLRLACAYLAENLRNIYIYIVYIYMLAFHTQKQNSHENDGKLKNIAAIHLEPLQNSYDSSHI